MRGHFRHFHFKIFLMVFWGPNLVHVCLFNQSFEIQNSCTSATPKMGVHLEVIGLHLLHSPPFVKVCFTFKHILLGLVGLCTLHLIMNPMLGLQHIVHHKCGVCISPHYESICMGLLKQEKEVKQEFGTKRKRCSFNIWKKCKEASILLDSHN
jgi:hypothetical protein